MKNVRKWKEVDGTPIYVWTGNNPPTSKQIQNAPMFTVFPGAKETDDLRMGGLALVDGKPYEEDAWFIAGVDGSDRWETMNDTVLPLLKKAGIDTADIEHEPQHNDMLHGVRVTIDSKTFTLNEDLDVMPFAIAAGWTLIKLPDDLGSLYWSTYTLDDFHSKGRKYWWTQTPLRLQLMGAGGANDPKLLAKVNRYRRSIGHTHDLQPGEWSDDDIRELLSHAPSRYRNPGSTQDPDALQQFLEEKTRQIVEAAREGWDEDDIEDLEAERDAVLQELSMAGPEYARRAKDAIERIEAKANPSGLEQLKRKLMR